MTPALRLPAVRLPQLPTPSRRTLMLGGAAVGVLGASVAAWTVLASTGFVWGAGVRRFHEGGATWEWWWYLLNTPRWHRAWPVVQRWLSISGIGAAVPVLGTLAGMARYAWRNRAQLRPPLARTADTKLIRGTSDNLGHADWLSMDRARELFPGPHPKWGGVIIGEAYRVDQDPGATMAFDPKDAATWGLGGKVPLLIDPCTVGPTHSLQFSGSGGGKTSAMIATLLHWQGPAVVVDPSREIGPVVRHAREAMGHKVVEIAPGGAGFDILAGIDPHSPNAVRRVLSVTASICGDEANRGRDAIFSDAGRNLVACLLADMIWDDAAPIGGKTLETFLAGITTPEADMKRLLSSIAANTKSSLARLLARTLMGLAEETFSGAYFNATTFVSWLFDDAVVSFLSGGDFEPAELLSERTTVFVQVPIPTLHASPAVVRVVLDAIAWAFVEADGDYARRCLLQTDETKRIGRMNVLDLVLGTGRKYGLTLQMAWLSEAEITETYGDGALDYWFENVSWRAYGAIRGRKTAEGVSKELGEYAVIATSEGDNTGSSGKPAEIGSRSSGTSANRHEVARALIKADELMEARDDELFVIARGRKLRCGRALYFRRPEMVEKTSENRFTKRSKAP